MTEGPDRPAKRPASRATAPHYGGPLGSSGAAPDPPAPEPPAPEAADKGAPDKGAPDEGAGEKGAGDKGAADRADGPTPGKTRPVPTPRRPADDIDNKAPAAGRSQPGPTASQPGPTASQPGPTASQPGGAAVEVPAVPQSATAGVAAAGAGDVAVRTSRLRRAKPVQVVGRAGRRTFAWAKRPSGRLIVPAVVVVLLLGAAGTAGAYLVPKALNAAPAPSVAPEFPADAGGAVGTAAPSYGLPGAAASGGVLPGSAGALPATTGPALPAVTGARPADALDGWAQQVGTRVGIPVVAVQAYGYAELVLARTMPSCRLSWTTIAAIAKVESAHGRYNGSVLGADGVVNPPIYGLALDGKGGRQEIRDTDQGTIDKDTTYDRAVGPLQFIPATWLIYQVDADNDGVANPNDIDDASLTAASYLCQGGRDMSKPDSWWDAILSYNDVRPYAQDVFNAANEYGRISRS